MSDDADDTIDDQGVTLELGPGDAAVVVRSNGDIESFLPPTKDEDMVSEGTPTMMVVVLLYILTDPGKYRILEQEFLEMAEGVDEVPALDPDEVLH